MHPTFTRLSKATRLPLSSKRANKDFYKGRGAAYLPGGHRTGAPGRHVIGGKAKYRIIDDKVRYYVSPSIEEITNSPLRPYVHQSVVLTPQERKEAYGVKKLDGKALLSLTATARQELASNRTRYKIQNSAEAQI